MRKRDSVESGSEEEDLDGNGGDEVRRAVASDYEKERLARIAENKARMEALGLSKMASSLTTIMGSSSQAQRQTSKNKKSKAKVEKDDDDYRPEDERPPSSDEEEEEDDEDDDCSNEDEDGNAERKAKKKGKAKNLKKKKITTPKSKKKASAKKVSSNPGYIDDDDEALKMAIALSLQESGVAERSSDEVGANQSQGDSVKINSKRRKTFASRLQMTEDELILHFYQFDENWNDGISVRDLERVANQHDFTWTDKELADMIRCFDSDGDGKISIDDFRKIAMRCKMIKGSEES